MSDERDLVRDLRGLPDRLADERFAEDLYRALASRRWHQSDDEAVSVSWQRAEEIVNDLREETGEDPLDLAQSGGEGELSSTVEEELTSLGWTSEPLDTSEQQPGHSTEPESPPPPDQGEREAPTEPPESWREAREEAERHRR
jgi:hypothetical protein